jgi:predicted membrane channel-forming protein YqfA (hemolysin III family)
MPKRIRKFVGALAMISFVIVYALIAMALAQSRIVREAPGLLQALYYIVLGMGWVLPMMPLIKWMERPDHA